MLFISMSESTVESATVCGGVAPQATVSDDAKALAEEMKGQIQAKTQEAGRNGVIDQVEVAQHMTQVVAGVNHFMKIRINDSDEHAFVCIYDRL